MGRRVLGGGEGRLRLGWGEGVVLNIEGGWGECERESVCDCLATGRKRSRLNGGLLLRKRDDLNRSDQMLLLV